MEKIEIRHIFYNEETLSQTPSSFIPLDNIDGDKSWYEFLPILNFLKNTKLQENVFYGFLSPSFTFKTRFTPEALINAVKNNIIETGVSKHLLNEFINARKRVLLQ